MFNLFFLFIVCGLIILLILEIFWFRSPKFQGQALAFVFKELALSSVEFTQGFPGLGESVFDS